METSNSPRLSVNMSPKKRILIVDDEPANLQVLGNVLQPTYQVFFAKNGKAAIEHAKQHKPDLILLDIFMPGLSGFETIQELQDQPGTRSIPVIFITAMSSPQTEKECFDYGAVDFISKPINPDVVRARVRSHLSMVKVDELNRTREEVIRCLGNASEYKDYETGLHVVRMSHYSKILALAAGLDEHNAEMIRIAAPMHDVGKIGIPDEILQKPGKLDDYEWQIMQLHPEIGFKIIGCRDVPLLELAASIAYTHHEKWNGQGYPRQLKGEEIPLEGRIVAIADVFDALTTQRPYKQAWSIDKALDYLKQESGEHFDPNLVPLFIKHTDEILAVKDTCIDQLVA